MIIIIIITDAAAAIWQQLKYLRRNVEPTLQEG